MCTVHNDRKLTIVPRASSGCKDNHIEWMFVVNRKLCVVDRDQPEHGLDLGVFPRSPRGREFAGGQEGEHRAQSEDRVDTADGGCVWGVRGSGTRPVGQER